MRSASPRVFSASKPLRRNTRTIRRNPYDFHFKLVDYTGRFPLAGVGVVPAGVVRVAELQEQGYVYVRS
jgi:hypothetical protein